MREVTWLAGGVLRMGGGVAVIVSSSVVPPWPAARCCCRNQKTNRSWVSAATEKITMTTTKAIAAPMKALLINAVSEVASMVEFILDTGGEGTC